MILDVLIGVLVAFSLIPLLPALIYLVVIAGAVGLLPGVGVLLHAAGVLVPILGLFVCAVCFLWIVGGIRRAIAGISASQRSGEKSLRGEVSGRG